jgi:hypothetical protein
MCAVTSYNERDMSRPPRCPSVARRERLADLIRIARLTLTEWSDRLRGRTTFATGGRKPMSDPMERQPEGSETQTPQAEGSETPTPQTVHEPPAPGAPAAPSPPGGEPEQGEQAMGEPMGEAPVEGPMEMPARGGPPEDLGQRFEAELRRVKDAVVSAESAASAVGLQTTVTSGRIECDYDIEGDSLVFRSVSFELEF